jgi:arabinose-5-phosphate isomerase
MSPLDILEIGKACIRQEAEAVTEMVDHLDDSFVKAVELILSCKGKLIFTGMGKSGIVAHKLAATFASTGTTSVFMHPAEALHGDLGMVTNPDVVIAISKTGETEEILLCMPSIKRIGAKVITIVNRDQSSLAASSDITLYIPIDVEAGHIPLVPTVSTLTAIAMGDALAVTVMKLKNFQQEDYAVFHPSGAIGKRLLLKVKDVMHGGDNNNPLIHPEADFKQVLRTLTDKKFGAVNIVDSQGKLIGLITDGDIKRVVEQGPSVFDKKAQDFMTKTPITVNIDGSAYDAFKLMEERPAFSKIFVLPVVDNQGKAVGMLRLHDLMNVGF